MILDEYCQKFAGLRINSAHGAPSPHKPCMLLAVLDMARSGTLTQNKIYFSPSLLERYVLYFDSVRTALDHRNPFFPFFHLAGSLRDGRPSFWHLKVLPGRESTVASLDSARRAGDITENVDYAFLDPELYALLAVGANIDRLAEALSRKWFQRRHQEMLAIIEQANSVARYENVLRQLRDPVELTLLPSQPVRDAAFRRVVIQTYDFRCCATGARLILPDGSAMVQAAHIHPFCEARDDDPRNGLALTPDMHWAMDQHLIAPGPDYLWHVSAVLESDVAEHSRLRDLDGTGVLLPKDPRFLPKHASLEWRVSRLRSRLDC